jgi:hypothetical protein
MGARGQYRGRAAGRLVGAVLQRVRGGPGETGQAQQCAKNAWVEIPTQHRVALAAAALEQAGSLGIGGAAPDARSEAPDASTSCYCCFRR